MTEDTHDWEQATIGRLTVPLRPRDARGPAILFVEWANGLYDIFSGDSMVQVISIAEGINRAKAENHWQAGSAYVAKAVKLY